MEEGAHCQLSCIRQPALRKILIDPGYRVRCAERTLAFGGSSLLNPDANGVRNADMNSGGVGSRFFANYEDDESPLEER